MLEMVENTSNAGGRKTSVSMVIPGGQRPGGNQTAGGGEAEIQ